MARPKNPAESAPDTAAPAVLDPFAPVWVRDTRTGHHRTETRALAEADDALEILDGAPALDRNGAARAAVPKTTESTPPDTDPDAPPPGADEAN